VVDYPLLHNFSLIKYPAPLRLEFLD